MGLVYAHAAVTIAAAASDHCDGGCLHGWPQESYSKQMTIKDEASSAQVDKFYKPARTTFLATSSEWSKTFAGNPLLFKGWTLQERELSPRVLYFTSSDVL